MEKKRLVVNAAICDARNVSEATLDSYESIDINAANVLVSKESKELMSKYNINMNTADVLEANKDAELMVQNGRYEISSSKWCLRYKHKFSGGIRNVCFNSGKWFCIVSI